MKILERILTSANERDIKFLVIGGHALGAHGFVRQTGDLDILVKKSERSFWRDLMSALQYTATQKHEVFERYNPSSIEQWPIDFMFVDDSVFDQLLSESIMGDFSSVQVPVPSIRHMIALKLHSLKQRQAHREEKDLSDVRELLRLSNLVDNDFRQLCEKYDRIDLYEKLKRDIK